MKLKTVYVDEEFNQIVEPIITNEAYQMTRNCIHHGINRYDHMIRVAYYSYKITKFCHLNYIETTRGSVLHDFFMEDGPKHKAKRLVKHADQALENSMQYFELNDLEKDIIKTHMFPFGKNIPRYLESWIVDVVDDIASIFEKTNVMKEHMSAGFSMLLLMFWFFIKK